MSTHRMGRVGSRRLMALTVGVAVAGLLAAPSAAALAGATPGAAGAGDPYFPLYGNGGYDVSHYLLDVKYVPKSGSLTGVATIEATATQALSRFDLDLVGLTVRSVQVNGVAAQTARSGQELIVTPAAALPAGKPFTTVVRYDGRPEPLFSFGGLAGWVPTDDGAVVAGEPEVAATWFPVNDHPRDKAAYTVRLTVPKGKVGLSNGRLLRQVTRGDFTTWTWDAPEPMASYLVTATVGDFTVRHSRLADGTPVIDAVDPKLRRIADRALALTPSVIAFHQKYFGPYPFSAAGGIVDQADIGFALENQTRPIYSPYFFDGSSSEQFVIVHEQAHQWFGDSVSLTRWKDIWLNEGFATYAEWLWAEKHRMGSAQSTFDAFYASHPADLIWYPPPGNPGVPDLFGVSVYVRGAMTLHALRMTVGDAAFFKILKGWATTNRYGNVTTEQFVAYAERISGRDLGALFDRWLYLAGKPAYPVGRAPAVSPSVAAATADYLVHLRKRAAAHSH